MPIQSFTYQVETIQRKEVLEGPDVWVEGRKKLGVVSCVSSVVGRMWDHLSVLRRYVWHGGWRVSRCEVQGDLGKCVKQVDAWGMKLWASRSCKGGSFEKGFEATKVVSRALFYGHGVLQEGAELLVDGKVMKWSECVSAFRVEYASCASSMPARVFDLEGRRMEYFHRGFECYDASCEQRPYKQVVGGVYRVAFCFFHDQHLDTAKARREFLPHSWVRLTDGEGKVWSFGRYPSREVLCPDPAEYSSRDKDVVEFVVTREGWERVFSYAVEYQKRQPLFHFLTHNCSDFTSGCAKSLGMSCSSEMEWKDFMTFGNRLRFHELSLELSKSLENKGILRMLARLRGQVSGVVLDTLLYVVRREMRGSLGVEMEGLEKMIWETVPWSVFFLGSREKVAQGLYGVLCGVVEGGEGCVVQNPLKLFAQLRTLRVEDE